MIAFIGFAALTVLTEPNIRAKARTNTIMIPNLVFFTKTIPFFDFI